MGYDEKYATLAFSVEGARAFPIYFRIQANLLSPVLRPYVFSLSRYAVHILLSVKNDSYIYISKALRFRIQIIRMNQPGVEIVSCE